MKSIFSIFILAYFRLLARLQLKKNPRAVIVGVTGSAGKTSTRLAIGRILRTRGRVKTSAHANSESGIPLNILGLRPHDYSLLDWLRLAVMAPFMLLFNWEHYDYYVVEMGIDSPRPPKNMAYLLSLIRPHLGVVLNAGLVHAAGFDYLVKDRDSKRRATKLRQYVAREKMFLAQGIAKGGVAIINLDQPEFKRYRSRVVARQLTFGQSAGADLRLAKVTTGRTGFTLQLRYQSQDYTLHLADPFPQHFGYSLAAAVGVGVALGIPVRESLAALEGYRAPAGRLRLFAGQAGVAIVDSSYNSSPDTCLDSLRFFHQLAGHRHKLAVIGDMRELGGSTKLAHKQLAEWLINCVDEAILFGPATFAYTLPVLESHHFPAHHFTRMSDLTSYLRTHLPDHGWVIVKGSQNGILLERAVEGILQSPADAKLLCRRGPYWDKIRSQTK